MWFKKRIVAKYGKCIHLILVLILVSLVISGIGCSKKTPKSTGRILSIEIPKHRFQPGETFTADIKICNDGPNRAHFLVVLNILHGKKTVYDSHKGKKSSSHKGDECLDVWVKPGSQQTIGPFTYKIPGNADIGTYHVLAGLRSYPWEPLITFRGARFCPPETTFEVRK